jgi:hypothetical protein
MANTLQTENAAAAGAAKRKRGHLGIWLFVVFVVFAIIVYTQITIFVVQPIGAVPEGRTLIILRLNKTNFIDSADGMCARMQGGVSLMCRMMAMSAVLNKTTIIARLPYSETLYSISTDGKTYEH